jgi:hypothetical protein
MLPCRDPASQTCAVTGRQRRRGGCRAENSLSADSQSASVSGGMAPALSPPPWRRARRAAAAASGGAAAAPPTGAGSSRSAIARPMLPAACSRPLQGRAARYGGTRNALGQIQASRQAGGRAGDRAGGLAGRDSPQCPVTQGMPLRLQSISNFLGREVLTRPAGQRVQQRCQPGLLCPSRAAAAEGCCCGLAAAPDGEAKRGKPRWPASGKR